MADLTCLKFSAYDAITILYPVRAGETARVRPAEVRERHRSKAGAGFHRASRQSVG
jgi:hypothetical protein